jgi:hypothetical protein
MARSFNPDIVLVSAGFDAAGLVNYFQVMASYTFPQLLQIFALTTFSAIPSSVGFCILPVSPCPLLCSLLVSSFCFPFIGRARQS